MVRSFHSLYRCAAVAMIVLGITTGPIEGWVLFEGDGSDEPGFVPPPEKVKKKRRRPPARVSSAETQCPKPPIPDTPQSRTEKKKPPKPPVLFVKLQSPHGPEDWNTRPNDLNKLLNWVSRNTDTHFTSDCKGFGEIDVRPDANPILYRSGHFHFSFSPEERARLRRFCMDGGMLILNTGLGSRPFYESARRELAAVFPELPLQRLNTDHPVFHSYYDLEQVEFCRGVREAGYHGREPWLEGVTLNCRTMAVISRWGMAAGWVGAQNDDLCAYKADSAFRLGVNLITYSIAQRSWIKNVVRSIEYVDGENLSVGTLAVAQVIYAGEWKTRQTGLSLLLRQFNRKTGVPVKFGRRELKLTDPAILDSPLIYMTGHESFRLTPQETEALRDYLTRGGLLFAEACCGRKAFDAAFRKTIADVMPGHQLRPIDAKEGLLRLPNPIAEVAVTPALQAREGIADHPAGLAGARRQWALCGHLQPVRTGRRLGACPMPVRTRLPEPGRPPTGREHSDVCHHAMKLGSRLPHGRKKHGNRNLGFPVGT